MIHFYVRFLWFLTATINNITVYGTICPVPKPCYCTQWSSSRAYCDGQNLTSIPPLVKSGGSWIIDFSNNKIQTIEANAFSNVQLEQVYFSNNSITQVDDDAFSGSENTIDVLRLDGNQLRSVPNVVKKLRNLIGLNIQYNPISDLDLRNISKSFCCLSFGSKSLTSWPTGLRSMKGFLMLNVYGLPIDSIPEDAFQGFENTLQYLEISFSKLKMMPLCLNKLVNLQTLTLKQNELLTEFPEAAFQDLHNLTTVIIENNGFQSLPAVFRDSDKMYQVSLRGCPIEDIIEVNHPAKQQSQFSYLTITDTTFQTVPKALHNMNVSVIDLSNGNINYIDGNDFKNITSLANLVLSKNPIRTIDDLAFSDFSTLRYMSLDETMLTTVPKALINTNVTWINMNGTKVKCTCDSMGWMKTWQSLPKVTIQGSCVNTGDTIMSFIKTIIPTC